MSTGRILPGVATLGGLVYVVGGEHGSQILADGEIYSPEVFILLLIMHYYNQKM